MTIGISHISLLRLFTCLLCSLLLGAGVASCEESVDSPQPFLKLSTQEVQLTAEGGEATIDINTNRPTWVASSPREGEWLSLQPEGQSLKLRITPNPTPLPRTTYVLIDAGLAIEKVSIIQAANAQALDFEEGSIVLPQLKGSTLVEVPTGGADWSVSPKEETPWLQLIAKRNSLKLIAQTNHSDQERSTTLSFDIGGVQRDIVVRQPGVSLFVLACNPGTPFNVHKMLSFERNRGSFFTEFGAALPEWGSFEESYFFRTTSPLFKDMVYVRNTLTGAAPRVYTRSLSREGVAAVRSKAFQDFVKKNGYVRSEDDSTRYINERDQQEIWVDIRDDLGTVVLHFSQIYKQVNDYPTFAELDLGPLHLLHKPHQKVEQVAAFEAQQGSTFMDERSTPQGEKQVVAYNTNTSPLISRIYNFYTTNDDSGVSDRFIGSVEQYRLYYNDVSLALWPAGDDWRITREFAALLKRYDFEHLRKKGDFHVYGRRIDKLVLAIKAVRFADINSNRPTLQISVLYKPSEFAPNSIPSRRLTP